MGLCPATPQSRGLKTTLTHHDKTIEQIFAKLKALLRTAAARTVPDLWDAIRRALTRFTSQECRNCIEAAGYEDDIVVAT